MGEVQKFLERLLVPKNLTLNDLQKVHELANVENDFVTELKIVYVNL
jgi:hypothetical protein